MGQTGASTAIYNQTGGVFDLDHRGRQHVPFSNGSEPTVINISGGTFNEFGTTGYVYLGFDAAGTLNISGSGTMNLNDYIYDGDGTTGALNLSGGGVLNTTGQIIVGAGSPAL